MSGVEVLKEFLVSLGWKSDQAQERRFLDSIGTATKSVLTLSAAIQTVELAVVGMTQRVAGKFEQLAYASSRVNASVGNINAFRYAISQLGGTAEGAMSSLEAFSRKLRESPGQEAMLKAWGVQTRDAQGRLRDATELMKEFVRTRQFLNMPEFTRLHLTESMGIDERTYRALIQDVDRFTREYREKLKSAGIDPEAAAQNAQRFGQAWRSMTTSIEVLLDRVLMKFGDRITGQIEQVTRWVDSHGDEIATALERIITAVTNASRWIGEMMLKFLDFIAIADPIVQKVTGMDSAFSALAAVFLLRLIPGVSSLAGALLGLVTGAGWRGLMMGLGALGLGGGAAAMGGALLGFGAGMAPGGTNESIPEQERQKIQKNNPGALKQGGGDKGFWGRIWSGVKKFFGADDASARETVGGQPGGETPAPGKPGQYRPSYSLSEDDLHDDVVNTIAGEAQGNQESIDAVIHNMLNRVGTKAYGPSGNLREVARAPGQYAGYRRADPKQAEFIRSRIRAIASGAVPDSTGRSNEYRAGWYRGPWFKKHPNAPVIGGNRFAHNPEAGVGPYGSYEKPMNPMGDEAAAEARRRAFAARVNAGGPLADPIAAAPPPGTMNSFVHNIAHGHTLHAKTDIHVHGATDPGATAKTVAGIQTRVNSDLMRNLQGSAR